MLGIEVLLVEVLVAEMLEVLVLFVSGGKNVEGCMSMSADGKGCCC